MVLAHEFVTAAGARPTRSLILLHGILGSGQNLRTLARRFVEAHPEWTGVLVDLRRHGRSLETSGDDSLQGAADDVDALARTLALPPDGVVGHSFGGKVALAWLGTGRSSLKHVVVIDSNPGPRPDARGSEGTLAVVDDLASLAHAAFESRDAFIAALAARGHARPIAQWLAQSLRRDDDGWRFGPPIAAIRALLASYFAADLWHVLEAPPGGASVHLVVGERSKVLDTEDRNRANALAGPRVTVDFLPTDHWVHVEDLEGLLEVLGRRLGP